jgi:hypothetical protein
MGEKITYILDAILKAVVVLLPLTL